MIATSFIRHGLMLLWFTDLMNVTEEVTIYRPNVSTLLSSAHSENMLQSLKRFLSNFNVVAIQNSLDGFRIWS